MYWKWVFSLVLRVIKLTRRRPRFSQQGNMMIKRIFVKKNFGLCVEGRVHELKIYSKWVHYQPFLMLSKNHFAVKKTTTAVKQKNPSKTHKPRRKWQTEKCTSLTLVQSLENNCTYLNTSASSYVTKGWMDNISIFDIFARPFSS